MTRRSPDRRARARRHWITVLAITALGGAAGLAVGLLTTPVYTATANVFIASTFGASGTDLSAGAQYARLTMGSYGYLATSPAVLQPVITQLGLRLTAEELAQDVSATNAPNSTVMQVSDTDASRARAVAIANAVAQSLAGQGGVVSPKRATGAVTMAAQTVEPAQEPTMPSAPKTPTNLGVGLAAGLVLGLGVASLRRFGSRRIRTVAGLAAASDAPFLGSLERRPARGGQTSAAMDDGASQRYRTFAANFRFLSAGPIVAVLADPDAGDSGTVALNLARVLAEASRVLLIDADLRRATAQPLTGHPDAPGLTTVLTGETELADAVHHDGALDVLTTGASAASAAVLLSSPAMATLVERARERYEVVLVATAGVLRASDTLAVGRLADGLILVADRHHTRSSAMEHASAVLDRAGMVTLGVALSGARASRSTSTRRAAGRRPHAATGRSARLSVDS